jgi:uncharacterized membrane protein YfcA
MLDSFPIAVIAGLILGYMAGLGIGGGSLLILWLTLVLGMESTLARSINLMFFIGAAGAVSIFRWKKGALDLKRILPAIVSGAVSAAAFSLLSLRLDVEKLRFLFGFLLLAIGIREVLYRPAKLR